MSPLRAAPFLNAAFTYQEDFPYADGDINGQGPWATDYFALPSLVVNALTVHTDPTGNAQSQAVGVLAGANLALPWSVAIDLDYIYDPGNFQAISFYVGDLNGVFFLIQFGDFAGDGTAGNNGVATTTSASVFTNIVNTAIALNNSLRITLIFDGTSILIDVDGVTYGTFFPGDLATLTVPNLGFNLTAPNPAAGFIIRQIAFAGFI